MTPYGPIVGVLLAGGKSSRFRAGDKALAMLAGKPLIERAAERLAPQVDALVLSANGNPSRFSFLGLAVVADCAELGALSGPLAGLLAGMEWAKATHPHARYVVTAAADTPFFPANLVTKLAETAIATGTPAIAASSGGVHPVFGLWPVSLASTIRAHLHAGKRKALAFAREQDAAEVLFPPAPIGGAFLDPFFNINRQEDFAEAESVIGTQDAGS